MFWLALPIASNFIRQRVVATTSMASMMLRLRTAPLLQPQLIGISEDLLPEQFDNEEDYSIWFAVPKRKHTKSRKRKKTTVQKRLLVKQNIMFDRRTGEVTLSHRMPFNWKDYLPKLPE
jgi:ribosomal protein L32